MSGWALVALIVPAACASFGASSDADAAATGDGGAGDAPGTGSDGENGFDSSTPSAPGCPSGRGPSMVRVELPSGQSFCIDSTEVTRAQYKEFLDTGPSTSAQPALCAPNNSFQTLANLSNAGVANLPVVQVDWCDALAFCSWAGKRLCGDLADGGPLPLDAAASSTRSEWTIACSRNGSRAYPYGGTYQQGACNVGNEAGAFAVGTTKGCQGGYDGIFDMVGNVSEWENACDSFQVDGGGKCAERGTSYKYIAQGCSMAGNAPRASISSDWGIRCCATPQ